MGFGRCRPYTLYRLFSRFLLYSKESVKGAETFAYKGTFADLALNSHNRGLADNDITHIDKLNFQQCC